MKRKKWRPLLFHIKFSSVVCQCMLKYVCVCPFLLFNANDALVSSKFGWCTCANWSSRSCSTEQYGDGQTSGGTNENTIVAHARCINFHRARKINNNYTFIQQCFYLSYPVANSFFGEIHIFISFKY